MSFYNNKNSKSYITKQDIETSTDILSKIKDFLFKFKNNKSHKKTIKIYKYKSKNKTMKKVIFSIFEMELSIIFKNVVSDNDVIKKNPAENAICLSILLYLCFEKGLLYTINIIPMNI